MIFDSLVSLSSTIYESDEKISETTSIRKLNYAEVIPEPLDMLSIPISKSNMRITKSLLFLLFFMCDDVNERGDGRFDGKLTWPLGQSNKSAQEKCPRVFAWLERNRSLRIAGKTLENWLPYAKAIFPDKTPIDFPREPLSLEKVLDLNMRLSTTEKGHLGWVVDKAKAGDKIALLLGCSVPVILRARPEGGWYLIGDAIIHGIMNFEAFAGVNIDDLGFLFLY